MFIGSWIRSTPGATSATMGYRGYQHASCISLNEVVCHGIPSDDEQLVDKDILSKMWVLRRILNPMGVVDGMEFPLHGPNNSYASLIICNLE